MIKNIFTLVLFLIFVHSIYSQDISTSVSNYLKAGSGFEFFGERQARIKKNYFENFSDVRIFVPKLTVGFRLEYSNPPEYGFNFIGLRKRFIEFGTAGLNLRAGDFYTLFARGLSINLFENRNLAFDNGIDGLKLSYENDFLKAQMIGGDLNYNEPLSIYLGNLRSEKYKVRAASLEITPIKDFSVGANFTWSEGYLPSVISRMDTIEVHIPEFFFKTKLWDFDLFASYAIKRTSLSGKDTSKGSGFYSSLSYSTEGFGITFEYKDYRFDIVDPSRRTDIFRPTRALPFQNPPTVHKEHIFTLTQRLPHVVDFNDEVGFQIDAFFSPSSSITFNANIALSSRHYDYELDLSTFQFERRKVGSDLFPSLNKLRSPFWEIYFDVEYYLPDEIDSYIRLGFNRRSETINERMNFTNPIQTTRITTIPLEVQKVWNDYLSTKFISESQWIFEFPQSEKFFNQFFSISFNLFSKYSFGLRYELTTNKFELENRKNWLVFEGGYRIGSNHTLIINYGKERGGTVCSNGICRQVLPFDGFRLSLTTNI
ncbi:MAG: DUF6029 family protein [Ignavibacteria bacterium]|nr:DUF6029 family protein [Ignavibacteria bacterium]MDH7528254.1 DUF6029 family protein [Ignavibacteria bacterium]